MQAKFPLIGDVRGLGLLMGIELVRGRATMERASDEAEQIMYGALTKGLNFKLTMGNIITLTPALTITQAEMDQALDILETSIAAVS
jgi:4-aminobutyrate aminotransferase